MPLNFFSGSLPAKNSDSHRPVVWRRVWLTTPQFVFGPINALAVGVAVKRHLTSGTRKKCRSGALVQAMVANAILDSIQHNGASYVGRVYVSVCAYRIRQRVDFGTRQPSANSLKPFVVLNQTNDASLLQWCCVGRQRRPVRLDESWHNVVLVGHLVFFFSLQ